MTKELSHGIVTGVGDPGVIEQAYCSGAVEFGEAIPDELVQGITAGDPRGVCRRVPPLRVRA
jgi:hypothetical protein